MRKKLSFTAVVLLIGFVSGCGSGSNRNAVSGTVSYQGKPIKRGTINFRSEGKGEHIGTGEIVDGKYAIPAVSGLPAGKYVVAIYYPDPNAPAPKVDEAPGAAPPVQEMLPAKYNERSEIKKDIKSGSNEVNFDLQ